MIASFASSAVRCGAGPAPPATSYTTLFPLTEDPISEGGLWVCGGAVGGDWTNPETTPGRCFGSTIVSTTDDDIACLTTSFHANQYAQGTVFRQVGYTAPSSHESELLLRFAISSGVARGYEVTWGFEGLVQIVRWNGSLGDFTVLNAGVDVGPAVTGDVLRAGMIGSDITVFLNDESIATANDSTWTDGQPGLGFFPRTGATPEFYCWSAFTGGEL
jgi:hypothetical protein